MNRKRHGSLYRKLIVDNFEAYATIPSKEKRAFACDKVIDPIIITASGNFLVYHTSKREWVAAEAKHIYSTVMQALRDCKRPPAPPPPPRDSKTDASTNTIKKTKKSRHSLISASEDSSGSSSPSVSSSSSPVVAVTRRPSQSGVFMEDPPVPSEVRTCVAGEDIEENSHDVDGEDSKTTGVLADDDFFVADDVLVLPAHDHEDPISSSGVTTTTAASKPQPSRKKKPPKKKARRKKSYSSSSLRKDKRGVQNAATTIVTPTSSPSCSTGPGGTTSSSAAEEQQQEEGGIVVGGPPSIGGPNKRKRSNNPTTTSSQVGEESEDDAHHCFLAFCLEGGDSSLDAVFERQLSGGSFLNPSASTLTMMGVPCQKSQQEPTATHHTPNHTRTTTYGVLPAIKPSSAAPIVGGTPTSILTAAAAAASEEDHVTADVLGGCGGGPSFSYPPCGFPNHPFGGIQNDQRHGLVASELFARVKLLEILVETLKHDNDTLRSALTEVSNEDGSFPCWGEV